MGRPCKDEVKSFRSVTIESTIYDAIKVISKATNKSISLVIKEAIEKNNSKSKKE